MVKYGTGALVQIGFFQHECLEHLIQIITFALLTMMSVMEKKEFYVPSSRIPHPATFLLIKFISPQLPHISPSSNSSGAGMREAVGLP